MGLFYTNITVKGPPQAEIAQFMESEGRQAFIAPTIDGVTVIYDRGIEDDVAEMGLLAANLAARFSCAALAVHLHDGDVLYYELYQTGGNVDAYDSCPAYFTDANDPRPAGGDAALLCSAFGVSDAEIVVGQILRAEMDAEERHQRLNALLGFPRFAAIAYYGVMRFQQYRQKLSVFDDQTFRRLIPVNIPNVVDDQTYRWFFPVNIPQEQP